MKLNLEFEHLRVVALCGILARPALEPRHVEALAALVADPAWQPVPSLASFNLLLPLFRHHLQTAGLAEELFVRPQEGRVLEIPAFGDLALGWIRRRALQDALLTQLHGGGVERPMLIKGAALAALYPTPALRQMCDLDIVIAPEELARAHAVLTAHGWREHEDDCSQVWRHGDSGMLLDLHVPEGPLATRILAEAIPDPASRVPVPVFVPRPAAHLLILALHAANNGGNRIWRDVCDAHLLLGMPGWDPMETWDLAEMQPQVRVPLRALVCFLNRFCELDRELTEVELAGTDEEEAEAFAADQHQALYLELGTDTLSPAQLGLIKQTFRPMREHWAALRRAVGPRSEPHDTPAERDPNLGDLPPPGSAARQWLRLKFLGSALMARQLFRYRELASAHTRFSRDTKLFRAPEKRHG